MQSQLAWSLLAVVGFLALQGLLFNSFHQHLFGLQSEAADKGAQLERELAHAKRENSHLRELYAALQPDLLHDAARIEGPPQQMEFPDGVEDGPCVGGRQDASGVVAAVVTVTFNRPQYLERHLQSVLEVHRRHTDHRAKFPLFISQDGTPAHQGVANLCKSHAHEGIRYLHHIELAPPVTLSKKEKQAYYRIANHYKFLMQTFFDCFQYPRLIFLEDDMQLAPDFFTYFEAAAPLLDADPTLYCVSSWNDHGLDTFVSDPVQLHRSDFFPGLGWMLTHAVWQDIKGLWPRAYWDDWMRLSAVRKGRQCIRPEVCRNFNFGEKGSSGGQFFKRYLSRTRLNQEDIDWPHTDLSYLRPDRYEVELNATLSAAPIMSSVHQAKQATGDVRLLYDSQQHYEHLTGTLQMLREWKDGIPRGGYHGVVSIRLGQARIFIAPSPTFRPPDPTAEGAGTRTDATGALVRRKDRKAAMNLGKGRGQVAFR